MHPEQGPVWRWVRDNDTEVFGKFTPNYGKPGAGPVREIDPETLDEIRRIFEVTGGNEMYDAIERHSDRKAREMGFDGANDDYFREVYRYNSNTHN